MYVYHIATIKAFIINSKISPENTEQCFILPEIALTKFSDI